jgi:hypothetical protein
MYICSVITKSSVCKGKTFRKRKNNFSKLNAKLKNVRVVNTTVLRKITLITEAIKFLYKCNNVDMIFVVNIIVSQSCGQYYDHYFQLLLPTFCEKIAIFLKSIL